MITTDLRTAASLAAAADSLDRTAAASAARSGPASPARARPPRVLAGTPALLEAPAKRAPRTSRAVRSTRSSAAGYAQAKTTSKSSSSKTSASDPLAFLKDSKLSVDEKLMKLAAYLNGKWEKEMDDKMKQIAASEEAKKKAESKPSGSKGGGGLLGGVADMIHTVVAPASAALKMPVVRDVLKQVGGPVLAAGATALGMPALAPILLKFGPQLVDLASSLASAVEGAGAAAPGGGPPKASSPKASGGSATSSTAASKAMSDSEVQMVMMEIQRLQQKQQEMFGLVSNVLKSNHDVRMAVVANVR
jgi:hypothetical protein